jgi:hypothetical protein
VGGVDGGECDAPLKFFTYASDVDNFKSRLDPLWDAADASVQGCASMVPDEKRAWALQLQEWRTLAAKPTPTFGTHGEWVNVCAHAKILDGWRDRIAKMTCAVIGPQQIKGYELPSSVADSLRYLSYGVIAVGGLAVLAIVLPEIKAGIRALKR